MPTDERQVEHDKLTGMTIMLELESRLMAKLDALQVRIDVSDQNTVIFHNVPANGQYFSKDSTNLLIKQLPLGMRFLVCVDEDFEYEGFDPSLVRALAGGIQRNGWRALRLTSGAKDSFQSVLSSALAALGSDGHEPYLRVGDLSEQTESGKGFLSVFGVDLTQQIQQPDVTPTVGRTDEIEEVVSHLHLWDQPRLVLIVGESGVGKTSLLRGIAGRLHKHRPAWNLMSVDLIAPLAGANFDAEHENSLVRLLGEAASVSETVVALEHLELALVEPRGTLLLARCLDQGRPLIGTILPAYLPIFQRDPLARRVHILHLRELAANETVEVLFAVRDRIASHHEVEIDNSCIGVCAKAATTLPGRLPAQAIALLDAAAATAALAGAKVVAADDICFAAKNSGRVTGPEAR